MTPIDQFFLFAIAIILLGCTQIIREMHWGLLTTTLSMWMISARLYYDQLPIAGLVVVGLLWVHKMWDEKKWVIEDEGRRFFSLEWNKVCTHETYIVVSLAVVASLLWMRFQQC